MESSSLKRKLEAPIVELPSNENKRRNIDVNSDEKISYLVESVLAAGPLGNLVIMQNENESPFVTLQNAASSTKLPLNIIKKFEENTIELQIDSVKYAEVPFCNLQEAKKVLGELALKKLEETCFIIHRKKNFVNVTKDNLLSTSSTSDKGSPLPQGHDSIAHKIMMKMGWAGGGLGANEQGNLDTVVLSENVNRQGLGSDNLNTKITKKLSDFSKSSNSLTLVFDSDFRKDERMLIHKIARKFNLRSKSNGSDSRKLTVSRKITKIDIVKELLKLGGEDGLYKLHIPTKFAHLWA